MAESTRESMQEMDFRRSLAGAALAGDVARMQTLLGSGANANGDEGDVGYAPLHYAARQGHLGACRLLLDHGALVDRRTRAGQSTSLHRAAFVGHYEIVRLLLQRRADPLAEDSDHHTALRKAEMQGHMEVAKLLRGATQGEQAHDK